MARLGGIYIPFRMIDPASQCRRPGFPMPDWLGKVGGFGLPTRGGICSPLKDSAEGPRAAACLAQETYGARQIGGSVSHRTISRFTVRAIGYLAPTWSVRRAVVCWPSRQHLGSAMPPILSYIPRNWLGSDFQCKFRDYGEGAPR